MTTRNFTIFLALAFIGLALVSPLAYGQMTTIPKYDVKVTLDHATPAPGDKVMVIAHVTYFYYQQGADPSAKDIYVRYSLGGPSGETSLAEGYTNDHGDFAADIAVPASPGDYTVNVYVSDLAGGDIFGMGAVTFTAKQAISTPVAVTPAPTPTRIIITPTQSPVATPVPTARSGFSLDTGTLLIVGAVIVGIILLAILALAAFAFLWTRRKLAVSAATAGAPGDGQSAIPVRVMFKNGLGMARRMKEDVPVEMSATAGSIGNAVIGKGTDAAEASLMTSKEFGPVTVTAKAGKKTATAKVRFTSDNAKLGFVMVPDSLSADGTSVTVGVRVVDANGNVIAPLEDLAIDLKTTLGTVTGRAVIKAKTLEAGATITAGTAPGNATVTATAGALKGEVTITIKEKPGRYCMHCGSPMEKEAANCPRCGLTPPSGVDTKLCPACGTVIPEAAKFCNQCGAVQPEMAKAVDPNAAQK